MLNDKAENIGPKLKRTIHVEWQSDPSYKALSFDFTILHRSVINI